MYQFGIDVKYPEDAKTHELAKKLMDLPNYDESFLSNVSRGMSEWCYEWATNAEDILRKRYPSFDLRVYQEGRSGGQMEIRGTWNSTELENEHPLRRRTIRRYILRAFEDMVNKGLQQYNLHCQYLIEVAIEKLQDYVDNIKK